MRGQPPHAGFLSIWFASSRCCHRRLDGKKLDLVHIGPTQACAQGGPVIIVVTQLGITRRMESLDVARYEPRTGPRYSGYQQRGHGRRADDRSQPLTRLLIRLEYLNGNGSEPAADILAEATFVCAMRRIVRVQPPIPQAPPLPPTVRSLCLGTRCNARRFGSALVSLGSRDPPTYAVASGTSRV